MKERFGFSNKTVGPSSNFCSTKTNVTYVSDEVATIAEMLVKINVDSFTRE